MCRLQEVVWVSLLNAPPSSCPSNLTNPLPLLDYCIVAFFIVLVISTVQWFLDGRKNFKGPKVELVGETPIRAAEVGRAGGVESDSSGAKHGAMIEERA